MTPLKILIVDDEEPYLFKMGERLRSCFATSPQRVEIELCNNVYHVSTRLKDLEVWVSAPPWDVIVADVFMPFPKKGHTDKSPHDVCEKTEVRGFVYWKWEGRPGSISPKHGGFAVARAIRDCYRMFDPGKELRLIVTSSWKDSRKELLSFIKEDGQEVSSLSWMTFLDKGLDFAGTTHEPLYFSTLKQLILSGWKCWLRHHYKTLAWSSTLWSIMGTINEAVSRTGMRGLLLRDDGHGEAKLTADMMGHAFDACVFRQGTATREAREQELFSLFEHYFESSLLEKPRSRRRSRKTLTIMVNLDDSDHEVKSIVKGLLEGSYLGRQLLDCEADVLFICSTSNRETGVEFAQIMRTVDLDALGDRRHDVVEIVRYLVQERDASCGWYTLTDDAIDWLLAGNWQGTRQELQALVTAVMNEEYVVSADALKRKYQKVGRNSGTDRAVIPVFCSPHEKGSIQYWLELWDYRVLLEQNNITFASTREFTNYTGIITSNRNKALKDAEEAGNLPSEQELKKIRAVTFDTPKFRARFPEIFPR